MRQVVAADAARAQECMHQEETFHELLELARGDRRQEEGGGKNARAELRQVAAENVTRATWRSCVRRVEEQKRTRVAPKLATVRECIRCAASRTRPPPPETALERNRLARVWRVEQTRLSASQDPRGAECFLSKKGRAGEAEPIRAVREVVVVRCARSYREAALRLSVREAIRALRSYRRELLRLRPGQPRKAEEESPESNEGKRSCESS